MDQRQAAADISQQPMPEVPATSSSAWNALLRSALTETIQPKIDRWRSGLDALLVFLGLFSAIVTAFFVGSLNALKPDTTARTNELLSNLTNIIMAISGSANMSVAQPELFQPDASDVRLNSYWSLSLVLSLSLAALAVVFRGFLNTAAFSRDAKASDKLVDIHTRWSNTEKILGNTVEALPPLLVIPVLLFIVGLLDTLLVSVFRLNSLPAPILVTSVISLFVFIALVGFLVFATVDGSVNPTTSPFQSFFSLYLRSSLPAISSVLSTRKIFPSKSAKLPIIAPDSASLSSEVYKLLPDAKVYHETIQTTHDDDALDQASAALFEVTRRSLHPVGHTPRIGPLADEEHATLLHLLSPEASIRSSRTAAEVIIRLHADYFFALTPSEAQIDELVPALAESAKRSSVGASSLSVLWDSPFLRAMSIVVDPDLALRDTPPAMWFLGSSYCSWEYIPAEENEESPVTLHGAVISFVLKILVAKLVEALVDSTRATEDGIVDSILSPESDLGEPPNPRHFLAAMLHIPSRDDLTLLVMWLSRIHPLRTIIRATHDNVESLTTEQMMQLGLSQSEMLPAIVATVGQVCLAQDDFSHHDLLLKLCIFTFFKTVSAPEYVRDQFEQPQMHWGPFDLVDTILTVAHAVPLPDLGSPLLDDLVRIREVVLKFSVGSARRSTFSISASERSDLLSRPTHLRVNNEMEYLLAQFKSIYNHATASNSRSALDSEQAGINAEGG
ncbi:hypothetical protein C8R43DRAFT_520170 [Mycena crocata]|nr:hypothetical protein C8R43DRAFT_520170 [Mycena crocata]